MAKKSAKGGKGASTLTLPDELGGGTVTMKALIKHPLVAELAAQALEAMAADIRAKLAKPAPKTAAPKATTPKPAAKKPAAPKAAKPAAPRRKPTAPGTDTTQ